MSAILAVAVRTKASQDSSSIVGLDYTILANWNGIRMSSCTQTVGREQIATGRRKGYESTIIIRVEIARINAVVRVTQKN